MFIASVYMERQGCKSCHVTGSNHVAAAPEELIPMELLITVPYFSGFSSLFLSTTAQTCQLLSSVFCRCSLFGVTTVWYGVFFLGLRKLFQHSL